MTDWTAGYIADIGYTYGYYTELNPLRLQLAFLNAGLAPPEVGSACELGFGQGISANIHAAASVTQWHGTDFNPSQAGFAQELATASGAGAQLHDDAFADFCHRPDLPDFDYIGLHGIWSWISDANRAVIVDFVRRKLKVGGVLYISYNTLPGWSAHAPIRHLLTQHAASLGAEGAGIVNRIDGALGFAEKLLATNPAYLRANPSVKDRLNTLKGQNRNYLAHEYFNADWLPMYFADMAKWLSSAKVGYACSANLFDHVDAVNLTPEQQAMLADIADRQLRESVRDYMVNQQFRKDYWVKGARAMTALEQAEALRSLRLLLTQTRTEVNLKVNASIGEASLQEAVYGPLLDQLADHKAKTLGQLEAALAPAGINFAQVLQAVVMLTATGALSPVQDEANIAKARQHTDKLNAHLMHKSRSSSELNYLASPVTGGGIAINRFQQLFLLARSKGHKLPAGWAQFVWAQLAAQGQRIVKEGQQLNTAEENMAELSAQAQTFADKQLPILQALQIT